MRGRRLWGRWIHQPIVRGCHRIRIPMSGIGGRMWRRLVSSILSPWPRRRLCQGRIFHAVTPVVHRLPERRFQRRKSGLTLRWRRVRGRGRTGRTGGCSAVPERPPGTKAANAALAALAVLAALAAPTEEASTVVVVAARAAPCLLQSSERRRAQRVEPRAELGAPPCDEEHDYDQSGGGEWRHVRRAGGSAEGGEKTGRGKGRQRGRGWAWGSGRRRRGWWGWYG